MKLVSIVGARPQFIKLSPVLKAIDFHNHQSSDAIHEVLVHSGQHYDRELSEVFFEQLEIKEPNYNLGVGSGPQGEQTGEMLKRIERVLVDDNPDWVMVYGDTNTTLAGALAATKLHIPVAHVEAGLRSFNKRMPEEINRILTDHVSNLLLCPTELAVEHLQREGITSGVINVGDVMYDSVLHFTELAEAKSSILKNLSLVSGAYILATCHRAENTDDPERLGAIFHALDQIAEQIPVILPLHPRTQAKIKEFSLSFRRVRAIDPVSYLDMLLLEKYSKVIVTDSGGVQKEAYFFKVPCVTLREDTEWDETVESGWNRLVGASNDLIVDSVLNARLGEGDTEFFGDGTAAEKIVNELLKYSKKGILT